MRFVRGTAPTSRLVVLALLMGLIFHAWALAGEQSEYRPRFNKAQMLKGNVKVWRKYVAASDAERKFLVSTLIGIADDRKSNILHRRNAIFMLHTVPTQAAIDYCIANVSMYTPGIAANRPQSGNNDPDYVPRFALMKMGWAAIGRIREAFVDRRSQAPSDTDVSQLAVVLCRTCGQDPALALATEWAAGPGLGETNRSRLEKLKRAIGDRSER